MTDYQIRMNNLERVQCAAMPFGNPLMIGPFVVFRATGGWFVAIPGESECVQFDTMADALDTIAAVI